MADDEIAYGHGAACMRLLIRMPSKGLQKSSQASRYFYLVPNECINCDFYRYVLWQCVQKKSMETQGTYWPPWLLVD